MDTTDRRPVRRATRRTSSAHAAALSFVFPGLGQAYAGQPGLGLLFAAPTLVLVGIAAAAWVIGADAVLQVLLLPQALAALIVVDLALMAWRMAAIGHAALSSTARRGRLTPGIVGLLLVATAGMHLWTAQAALSAEQALTRIFSQPDAYVVPSASDLDPDVPAYRWDGTERVTFLLLGYDSGPGRTDKNADSMILVSVAPVAQTAFMVSIPRDTGYVPLPDRRVFANGVYPFRLNGIASVANDDRDMWCPGLDPAVDCGLQTLRQVVGLYTGLPIHYVAGVDLMGFAALVDAMGGIELCLPGVLADPEYGGPTWEGQRGIVLDVGCHLYDGAHALAYARIRTGTLTLPDGSVETQNDLMRAARQQEFLLALQRQVAGTNLLVALPTMLTAISKTVTTDFPRAQAGNLASLAQLIEVSSIERVVLGWPDYVELPVDPLRYYLLIPNREAVRAEMHRLLGSDGDLDGWYLGSTADGAPDMTVMTAMLIPALVARRTWGLLWPRCTGRTPRVTAAATGGAGES